MIEAFVTPLSFRQNLTERSETQSVPDSLRSTSGCRAPGTSTTVIAALLCVAELWEISRRSDRGRAVSATHKSIRACAFQRVINIKTIVEKKEYEVCMMYTRPVKATR